METTQDVTKNTDGGEEKMETKPIKTDFEEAYEIFKEKKEGAFIIGHVIGNPKVSHRAGNETFYSTQVEVKRDSLGNEALDILTITISNYVIDLNEIIDKTIIVMGTMRSRFDEEKHLQVTIFADNVIITDSETRHKNYIKLIATVAKNPVKRRTPSSKMDITDLFLKKRVRKNVNLYFPSIAWRRNAIFASRLKREDIVEIHGRLQSREYEKKSEDGTIEFKRLIHEISIFKISLISSNENEQQHTEKEKTEEK